MNKDDFQDDTDYADFVTPTFDCYEDDEVPPSKMPDIDDIQKEHDVDKYDQYIGAHVRVPIVKLLPLPQPPVRARTDARTNPSAQRATQLRSVLTRVYAVSIQNQITTTVP
jgi:hypothetical protein